MRLYKKTLPSLSITRLTLKKRAYTFPRTTEGYGRPPEEHRQKTGLALKFALALCYARVNMIRVTVAGRPSVKQADEAKIIELLNWHIKVLKAYEWHIRSKRARDIILWIRWLPIGISWSPQAALQTGS